MPLPLDAPAYLDGPYRASRLSRRASGRELNHRVIRQLRVIPAVLFTENEGRSRGMLRPHCRKYPGKKGPSEICSESGRHIQCQLFLNCKPKFDKPEMSLTCILFRLL